MYQSVGGTMGPRKGKIGLRKRRIRHPYLGVGGVLL